MSLKFGSVYTALLALRFGLGNLNRFFGGGGGNADASTSTASQTLRYISNADEYIRNYPNSYHTIVREVDT